MHDDYSLAQLLDPHGEPVALRAQDVAILLGCGPDAARNLMKSKGFPLAYRSTDLRGFKTRLTEMAGQS